jgi:potassium channel subfamily K, other eukaryote
VALPATIILFYFATGILIGITSSMNLYVPPGPDEVYSQGFWHAIIAACLYLFCSMILMVNMLGYFLGHYPQHFTLTDEQRNLILQTMMFFIWLAGGAAVFSNTSEEWQFVDALYFCDVTVLTVGFGDYSAPNDVSRGLVFPFSLGGIIMLGLMVSSIHRFAGELSKDNVIRKHMETNRQRTLTHAVRSSTEVQRTSDVEKKLDWGGLGFLIL